MGLTKKIIFLALFSLSMLKASADVSNSNTESNSSKTEADYCIDCQKSNESSQGDLGDQFRTIRNAVLNDSNGASAFKALNSAGWSDLCKKFSGSSEYGILGKQISAEFETQNFESLLNGSKDLKELCPTFETMNRSNKIEMWVMILAGIAYNESNCQEHPPLRRGPNGYLNGIFQLHKGKEHLYSKTCAKNAGAKAETSIPCTMAMLRNQVTKEDELFSKSSYWKGLHPTSSGKNNRIQEAIKSFPLCI